MVLKVCYPKALHVINAILNWAQKLIYSHMPWTFLYIMLHINQLYIVFHWLFLHNFRWPRRMPGISARMGESAAHYGFYMTAQEPCWNCSMSWGSSELSWSFSVQPAAENIRTEIQHWLQRVSMIYFAMKLFCSLTYLQGCCEEQMGIGGPWTPPWTLKEKTTIF